jgi:hypothetical protein
MSIVDQFIALMQDKVEVKIEYTHGTDACSVIGYITNFDFDKNLLSFEETKGYVGRKSIISLNSIARIIVKSGEKEKVKALQNKPFGM